MMISHVGSRLAVGYIPISLWHLLVTIHKITATAVYLKWPLRLLTASEVTSDLNFELSGLNNLCSSASLASLLLEKPFVPKMFPPPPPDCTQLTCRLVEHYVPTRKKEAVGQLMRSCHYKIIWEVIQLVKETQYPVRFSRPAFCGLVRPCIAGRPCTLMTVCK